MGSWGVWGGLGLVCVCVCCKQLHIHFAAVLSKGWYILWCISLFTDVVIPESPEAYIKLTESTLRSSSGTHPVSACRIKHTHSYNHRINQNIISGMVHVDSVFR